MNNKPLQVQAPTMDAQTLEKLAQMMKDMDSVVGGKQIEATSVRKSDMRAFFEQYYKKHGFDFTKHEEFTGNYRDHKVEAVYLSFKFALVRHAGALQLALKKVYKSSVQGPYIIGMQVDDATVQFGYRPFKHNNMDKARHEAEKLRDRNNKSYTIFGVMETVLVNEKKPQTVNAPVDETRQGANGKLVRSPFKVMTDWQQIIKKVDSITNSVPVSIGFTASGKQCVNYSRSQGSPCFDTYAECIRHVDEWIHEYHKTHPELKEAKDEPSQTD